MCYSNNKPQITELKTMKAYFVPKTLKLLRVSKGVLLIAVMGSHVDRTDSWKEKQTLERYMAAFKCPCSKVYVTLGSLSRSEHRAMEGPRK